MLRSSDRSLLSGGPSSHGAVTSQDPKRCVGQEGAVHPLRVRHFRASGCRRARRSSPPPALWLGCCFFSSLSRLLPPPCAPAGVVEGIIDVPAHPQAVKQHRELPRHGHRRPLLCILASAGGYLLSVAPQVRVRAEGAEDVVGAAHQQLPQHLVTLLGDAFLGVSIPRLVLAGGQPQVRSHGAALIEAVRIL